MTRSELHNLLKDVEIAQQQLQVIANRLKENLGMNSADTARLGRERPVASKAARDPSTKPDSEKLQKFTCPRCQAPMQWKWSPMNKEWFAGCTTFKSQSCRGSRTHDAVMGLSVLPTEAEKRSSSRREPHIAPHLPWATENFGDELPPPPESEVTPQLDEPEFTPRPEDLQILDKHHPGASQDEIDDATGRPRTFP